MVLPPLQLLVALLPLLAVMLLPQLLRRRRRRVSRTQDNLRSTRDRKLTFSPTEKEESDEDMGFGLFD